MAVNVKDAGIIIKALQNKTTDLESIDHKTDYANKSSQAIWQPEQNIDSRPSAANNMSSSCYGA